MTGIVRLDGLCGDTRVLEGAKSWAAGMCSARAFEMLLGWCIEVNIDLDEEDTSRMSIDDSKALRDDLNRAIALAEGEASAYCDKMAEGATNA